MVLKFSKQSVVQCFALVSAGLWLILFLCV